MKTIKSELELFKKTGNSAHARWVANELLKIHSESNLSNIEQLHDVTVGHSSGGEIKSGLLWSTVALVEAREALLRDRYHASKEALQKIRMLRKGSIPDCVREIAVNALKTEQEQGK